MPHTSTRTIGLLIRNSTSVQKGNYRSLAQRDDLSEAVERLGWSIRWYDEEGTSGADLSKRPIAQRMLADLDAKAIQGIGVQDISRASRDRDGVDFGIFLKSLRRNSGVIVTPTKVYNPRNKGDARTLRIEGMVAGMQWEDIREVTWSGRMKRLEVEPVCFGPIPRGYHLVPDAKGKRHLAKDPSQAALMQDIIDGFASEPSILRAAQKLGLPNTSLGRMLHTSLYWGEFTYGHLQASDVWEGFGVVNHIRDDLAYWTRKDAERWLARFKQGSVQHRVRKFPHPLLGVLVCTACDLPMVGHPKGYRCRRQGLCGTGTLLSDKKTFPLLRELLPELLANQRAMMDEATRQLATVDTADLEGQLDMLNKQEDGLLDLLGSTPTDRIRERLRLVVEKRAKTQADLDAKRREADITVMRRALVDDLGPNALNAFDHLGPSEQGLIYRELVHKVKIDATGKGLNRHYELISWEPTGSLLSDRSSSCLVVLQLLVGG